MSEQMTVIRGEDRTLILRMIFRESKEPYDLINWSKIQVEFKKANRTTLVKDSELKGGETASAIYENVTYTADTIGSAGNAIILDFDGIKDIDTVIGDWNTANPTNIVLSDAGDGSVVPPASQVQLGGGRDPYRDVEVINETLGKVSVFLGDVDTTSLKTGPNQSFKVMIDKGDHPNGDRRIVLFDSKLNVIDADL